MLNKGKLPMSVPTSVVYNLNAFRDLNSLILIVSWFGVLSSFQTKFPNKLQLIWLPSKLSHKGCLGKFGLGWGNFSVSSPQRSSAGICINSVLTAAGGVGGGGGAVLTISCSTVPPASGFVITAKLLSLHCYGDRGLPPLPLMFILPLCFTMLTLLCYCGTLAGENQLKCI